MTKGIREFVNEKFAALLPTRVNTREGNAAFRKAVMQAAMETHNISLASAATHYNFTLKAVREADPSLIEGLGRPEDKKGGRKPIHTVDVVKVKDGTVVSAGISRAKAEALVLASQAKGKVKLEIRETAKAEEGAPAEAAATGEQAPETAPTAETAAAAEEAQA